MRRKRARTIYWLGMAGAAAMAVAGPRLGALQASVAMVFAPVSHPANRIGGWLAGTMAEEPPLDPASPEVPRLIREIAEENERLRQRLGELQGQLQALQEVHDDRQSLGQSVLQFSVPVTMIGGDGDVLQVVKSGRGELEPGMPVLHYGRVQAGIAGVIASVGSPGAQVRLITDPAVRVEAVFARLDERTRELNVLRTERPLVEGAGDGLCQVARARREELEGAGVAVGDWALLADASWPELLRHYRIGQVAAIEDIPSEAGFVRVVIRPAVELKKLKELMVFGGRSQERGD